MINISALISKLTTDELTDLKTIVDKQFEANKNSKKVDILLTDLRMSINAYNILAYYLKISTLQELSNTITASEFKKCRNVGNKTFIEMTQILSENGLSWKREI